MSRYTKIGLIAITLAATGIGAYAAISMENEATALAQAKVSITQAIATAEQHANGKATRAELEQSKAGLTYDVEVVSGAKVFDVKVDADKGTVISSAEDKANRENDEDSQD
ncbi:peptidase propeptide and YPEB domain protein [mine drainage metagenome]|uniref:Peptidase propeptide and YPEB domain protein n=1 Tax=mine drainage metagenome TaxID=410659 RepID=A0A1J5PXX6_9ZZZZ